MSEEVEILTEYLIRLWKKAVKYAFGWAKEEEK